MSAIIQLHGHTTPPIRYGIVVSKICYVRPGGSGGTVVYLTPDSYLSVVEPYDDVVAAIEAVYGTPKAEISVEQLIDLTKRLE